MIVWSASNIDICADSFTVDCNSDAYRVYAVFAAIFIVIYPIGIIAFFVALLYLNRHALGEHGGGGEHGDRWWSGELETFDFLVDGYRRGAFWFEILEFLRLSHLATPVEQTRRFHPIASLCNDLAVGCDHATYMWHGDRTYM